jgi:hypothetical protein
MKCLLLFAELECAEVFDFVLAEKHVLSSLYAPMRRYRSGCCNRRERSHQHLKADVRRAASAVEWHRLRQGLPGEVTGAHVERRELAGPLRPAERSMLVGPSAYVGVTQTKICN